MSGAQADRVAIVLAAGAARRFGRDKLSALLDGEPLLTHAIRIARAAPVGKVLVATRPGFAIGEWPGEPAVERMEIESEALSTSLKAAVSSARQQGARSAFIFLGDMPRVPPDQAARLARIIAGNFAALPRIDGKPGHPVLLSEAALDAVGSLEGDEGAGRMLRGRDDVVHDDAALAGSALDIDRPADLDRLQSRNG